MKNIYLIATDKASNLIENNRGYALITDKFTQSDLDFIQAKFINIYVTNDEEIKYGDFCIDLDNNDVFKTLHPVVEWAWSRKIILTNDTDLIKDGVRQVSEEFLKWFVKNPNCEEVEVKKVEHLTNMPYRVIIPNEEPKQKDEKGRHMTYWGGLEESKQLTLKEVALNYAKNELKDRGTVSDLLNCSIDFINGAEYGAERQQERMYEIMNAYVDDVIGGCNLRAKDWFNQNKKK